MEFKKWLEMVMTAAPPKTPVPPVLDDEGDGDDDPEWDWDNLMKTHVAKVSNWCETSTCAQKIKRTLADMMFKQEPTIEPDIWADTEIPPLESRIDLKLDWMFKYDSFEDRLFNTLRNPRNCDLWRAFDVRPEMTWNLMDKGDVDQFVLRLLAASMTGYSFVGSNLTQSRSTKKATIDKYAKFYVHEHRAELEQRVKDEILDSFNLSQSKMRAESVEIHDLGDVFRMQMYGGEALIASAELSYDYKLTLEQ